jgi:hypothetical protein
MQDKSNLSDKDLELIKIAGDHAMPKEVYELFLAAAQ